MSGGEYEFYVRDDAGELWASGERDEQATLEAFAERLESRAATLRAHTALYQSELYEKAAGSVRALDANVFEPDSGVRIEVYGVTFSFHRDYVEEADEDAGEY